MFAMFMAKSIIVVSSKTYIPVWFSVENAWEVSKE
jgi:hypothetical protein